MATFVLFCIDSDHITYSVAPRTCKRQYFHYCTANDLHIKIVNSRLLNGVKSN